MSDYLGALAASAAGYWADILRSGRAPSLVGDAGHGRLSDYTDMLLHTNHRPAAHDAIDAFERDLAKAVAASLARCGEASLTVDYSPDGLLGDVADRHPVSGFPFKHRMSVHEGGVSVREGYRADDRWICQTKKMAIRHAISDMHWADSPWTEERSATRPDAEINAWYVRGKAIGAVFAAMPDTPKGDFDTLVQRAWNAAKYGETWQEAA